MHTLSCDSTHKNNIKNNDIPKVDCQARLNTWGGTWFYCNLFFSILLILMGGLSFSMKK